MYRRYNIIMILKTTKILIPQTHLRIQIEFKMVSGICDNYSDAKTNHGSKSESY